MVPVPRRKNAAANGLTNAEIAERLEQVAGLLEAQDANPFRVRAYRAAADRIRGLAMAVGELLAREGLGGLTRLPGIGESLARSIEQLARTGRLALLERLLGETEAAEILTTVPGIGPEMAARIHEQLGIESLEELELAAHDGRLGTVAGMGRKRLRGVVDSLAGRFGRRLSPPRRHFPPPPTDPPTVAELLVVDREYRHKAEAGRLPRIAPRRFNPTGQAWLPVLHTSVAGRHYTALFSNTARAHELEMTRDWVVVYRDDHDGRGQWTVVTARYGPLRGHRIIRGRESECAEHYARHQTESTVQDNLALE